MLRYLTAGESHGKALVALVDGFPAGVQLNVELIDAELRRRQGGYGRGGRQHLESDHVDILSGVWRGITLGSPIALMVPNKDYKIDRMEDLDRPRPGHGDLSGSIKYLSSIRAILERASARETAARVAAGALAKQLLSPFGIDVFGYVVEVGPIPIRSKPGTLGEQLALREKSEIYSLNPDQDAEVKALYRPDTAGRQHVGRDNRNPRGGRALRSGFARSMGPETRRPTKPGDNGHAGHQGRGDRHGIRHGPPAGLRGA